MVLNLKISSFSRIWPTSMPLKWKLSRYVHNVDLVLLLTTYKFATLYLRLKMMIKMIFLHHSIGFYRTENFKVFGNICIMGRISKKMYELNYFNLFYFSFNLRSYALWFFSSWNFPKQLCCLLIRMSMSMRFHATNWYYCMVRRVNKWNCLVEMKK